MLLAVEIDFAGSVIALSNSNQFDFADCDFVVGISQPVVFAALAALAVLRLVVAVVAAAAESAFDSAGRCLYYAHHP